MTKSFTDGTEFLSTLSVKPIASWLDRATRRTSNMCGRASFVGEIGSGIQR